MEGTVSEAVQAFGLRRSRYRGLPKARLQQQVTGAAFHRARLEPGSPTDHSPRPASRPWQRSAPLDEIQRGGTNRQGPRRAGPSGASNMTAPRRTPLPAQARNRWPGW
ncbi:hypothetical protein ABZ208_19875 [Streptomyces sp. NPDC006208]|uniref:hypothetical protein n=1 Tax=Streptomyces sp. NPDC006208 TaxID=3156734 RepID=UPI00339EC9E8